MLKECRSHGFFRDEFCPHCGSEGKFLLNDEEVEILGRTMAGVLRHFPERYGLEMDAHGWVDLRDFLTAVQIRNRRFRFVRQHHVVGLIETDPKGRYQFEDGKIRATYGHSKDLDLDLPTDGIPDVLGLAPISVDLRVKALNPGHGQGRQNNVFSDFCHVLP